jgi:hypothetical protein
VAHFAGLQTDQSKRLGMWMDWENSYYTFSDTNIEYIWRFLKTVHELEWLYKGHRSTQWCPRCGTSLSKHEQAGEENYVELEHPSLFVRFPLLDARASRSSSGRRPRGRCRRTSPPREARRRVRPAPERRLGRDAAVPGRVVRRAFRRHELVAGGTAARSTSCRRSRVSSTA